MAKVIWKKIVVTLRDGAYVRVSLPGKAEKRMEHRKQRLNQWRAGCSFK